MPLRPFLETNFVPDSKSNANSSIDKMIYLNGDSREDRMFLGDNKIIS